MGRLRPCDTSPHRVYVPHREGCQSCICRIPFAMRIAFPLQYVPPQGGLSRPCATALRRAAGRASGLGRRAGRHARTRGAAGPAAREAGAGAAGGAAPQGRLHFLSTACTDLFEMAPVTLDSMVQEQGRTSTSLAGRHGKGLLVDPNDCGNTASVPGVVTRIKEVQRQARRMCCIGSVQPIGGA